jgi:replicative DNA helicase
MENITQGKIPPQAIDIEEAVLGSMVLETHCIDEVISFLKPEDFYKQSHVILFSAIKSMRENRKLIDTFTLNNYLEESKEIDLVGGTFAVMSLTNKISSSAHINYHKLIIKEKSIKRKLIKNCTETINYCFNDAGIDEITSIVNTTEILNDISTHNTLHISDYANDSYNSLIERIKLFEKGETSGVPTGIKYLDQVTTGWQKSDLIILAGRPSMGKTALCLHFAKEAKGTLIYSLEMPGERLVDRYMIGTSGVDSNRFRSGNVNAEEIEKIKLAQDDIKKWNIFISDIPVSTAENISADAKKVIAKNDIKLIVIDYLGLIDHQSGRSTNDEVGKTTKKFKQMAKELDVPVILLCQLSRAVEKRGGDKRPQLSDLRDSGEIEQDADLVIFAYRPAYYGIEFVNDDSTENYGEMIIAKQRQGSLASVKFWHNDSMTEIKDHGTREVYTPTYDPTEGMRPNDNPF